MRPPHLFIFGLGYVGLRAGISCERELGWRVSGCCRSAEKAEAISAAHAIEAHTFDLDENYDGLDADGLAALADATHVLATTPPVADFDRDPLLALHTPELTAAYQRAAIMIGAGIAKVAATTSTPSTATSSTKRPRTRIGAR